MQLHASRCDCCGLPISGNGATCPRCGYPVEFTKEKQFLIGAVGDLARVATYGGAAMTVSNLLIRYQSRLDYLVGLEVKAQAQNAGSPAAAPPQSIATPVRPLEPEPPAVPVAPDQVAPINQPLMPAVPSVPQQA